MENIEFSLDRYLKQKCKPLVSCNRTLLYGKRFFVENSFEKLRRYQRIATRSDELAVIFIGFT